MLVIELKKRKVVKGNRIELKITSISRFPLVVARRFLCLTSQVAKNQVGHILNLFLMSSLSFYSRKFYVIRYFICFIHVFMFLLFCLNWFWYILLLCLCSFAYFNVRMPLHLFDFERILKRPAIKSKCKNFSETLKVETNQRPGSQIKRQILFSIASLWIILQGPVCRPVLLISVVERCLGVTSWKGYFHLMASTLFLMVINLLSSFKFLILFRTNIFCSTQC